MANVDGLLFRILQGDALTVLRQELSETAFHLVVTSPPYYKKRRYGGDPAREVGWGTPDEYLKQVVDILGAVNLHPRGSMWVNIGDTRNSFGCLHDIPGCFALMMEAQGWGVADHFAWAKAEVMDDGTCRGNVMPEPAPGRLNGNGFEDIYRFVRLTGCPGRPGVANVSEAWTDDWAIGGRPPEGMWRIPMGQTRRKHYAVFPPALVERPVAWTCPPWVCLSCGEPWDRTVEAQADPLITNGWSPTCGCGVGASPGLVCDPFMGSGTTGEVALKLGRRFVGIDLYEDYCRMAETRLQETLAHLNDGVIRPS
jgi:DNA modification methylase